jgi:hypothetical protein
MKAFLAVELRAPYAIVHRGCDEQRSALRSRLLQRFGRCRSQATPQLGRDFEAGLKQYG